jgi:hypothetical protein
MENSKPTTSSSFRQLKESLKGIDMIQVKTDQLVLVAETENNLEASLVINRTKKSVVFERSARENSQFFNF